MNEYKKRILQARNQFISLNFEQEKEIFNIYNTAGNNLIDKILKTPESRTRTHNIDTLKIINSYKAELYSKLNNTITDNIQKSSDIQKGVQLSFIDVIAPDKTTSEALKRTINKISNDTVKQLVKGEYYKDGKTLSHRIWKISGDNANKIDELIKTNIAKGANVKELAKDLEKYVNPKNRITPKTFADGLGGNNISYQARRLARTSITHAQTETMIQNAKKNPFCKGLKWNLSASHSSRMHGKLDECDDYNGRTFKPEDVPLQHPNCLCYFTEILEEFDKCIETMKDWSNGKSKPRTKVDIDEWIKAGEDETSIKVTTPDAIQTKIDINSVNNTINSKDLEKIQEYKPPLAKRHRLESLGKKSEAKDENTIILPDVDYNKDIEDIKKGLYNKVKDTYIINNRTYGQHGSRFYPIEGAGFITLDRNEYKILIKMKTESNNPRLKEILLKMGATEEIIEKISKILKAGENDG